MHEELIIAGFGGQGIMVMGQLLAFAGTLEGKMVSWIPSYGPEMRGGTANCSVIISSDEIASPIVTEADSLIVLNRPSLLRFESSLKPGGLILYDSSLIDEGPERSDIEIIALPANKIANDLGEIRVANMVLLGAYLAKTGVVSMQSIEDSLGKVLSSRRHHLIPLNKKALQQGWGMAERGQPLPAH
ncbi:MAG: 2-oxoacid:acceptor oxidoreductase family protein [Firmicutes bacterium]|nr:2-oxoacid:acceptor oxidoreductase family protein [Bacillota bacterium]